MSHHAQTQWLFSTLYSAQGFIAETVPIQNASLLLQQDEEAVKIYRLCMMRTKHKGPAVLPHKTQQHWPLTSLSPKQIYNHTGLVMHIRYTSQQGRFLSNSIQEQSWISIFVWKLVYHFKLYISPIRVSHSTFMLKIFAEKNSAWQSTPKTIFVTLPSDSRRMHTRLCSRRFHAMEDQTSHSLSSPRTATQGNCTPWQLQVMLTSAQGNHNNISSQLDNQASEAADSLIGMTRHNIYY